MRIALNEVRDASAEQAVTVAARPAATVVLVRPVPGRADGWEMYLLRRSAQSPVLADLWVFPGGTVHPEDRATAWADLLDPAFSPHAAHAFLDRPPGGPAATPAESLSYFVAAARELFEEAGVLLCRLGPDPHDLPAELGGLRRSVEERGGFGDLLTGLGLRLALGDLTYYGHWITPEWVPQRFDTRFFLAVLPPGQEADPSPFEMAEGQWIEVERALASHMEGKLPLHFATLSHLRRLAPYPRLNDLLAFARTKAVVPVMPTTQDGGTPSLPAELEGVW